MDLLLMCIMMWRELERPYPTLRYFLMVQADVALLQTCPSPARHSVERLCSRILYVGQDFQMSSNPSLFLGREQILSTVHV